MKRVVAETIEQAMAGPWFWIRNSDCSREKLLEHLGPAHWSAPEDGQFYDVDFWVFEASCGLKIMYSMLQGGPPLGDVSTSLPEEDHFLRHDPWARTHTISRIDDNIDVDHTSIIRLHQADHPELESWREFQAYRMGDDGNAMPIGYLTSETDVKCLIAELESHKHKQIYWYSKRDESAPSCSNRG